jgi:general nucleoside transport system permease protein
MDWRRFAVIALVIAVMFGIVILVGISENSPLVVITSMMATTIAVSTPLTLGALSGLYCERSGVVNIGI